MKPNIIEEKTYNFSKEIIGLYLEMIEVKEYTLSKQLLRSGTSIGANVVEADAASSTKDFIYKMSIASREARETRYWLNLIRDTQLVDLDVKNYLDAIQEIIKILTRIVKTGKENLNKNV